MSTVTAVRACVLAAVIVPAWAGAADRWEGGSIPSLSNDDTPTGTRNELRPGDRQNGHDLEGTPAAPDRDHYIVRTEIYHTYEALVRSVTERMTLIGARRRCNQTTAASVVPSAPGAGR